MPTFFSWNKLLNVAFIYIGNYMPTWMEVFGYNNHLQSPSSDKAACVFILHGIQQL